MERHMHDGMHILWKAGVASDFLGNVLVSWVESSHLIPGDALFPGDTEEARYAIASADFKAWCAETKVKCHRTSCFSALRLGRGKKANWPSLTDKFKCGDIRHMMYWLFEVHKSQNRRALERGSLSPMMKIRMAAFNGLVQYCHGISHADRLLSTEQRLAFHGHLQCFLKGFVTLARDAVQRGVVAMRLRPKLHALTHVSHDLLTSPESPACFEVWQDEDLCGQSAKVSSKCHSRTVCLRAIERYISWLVAKCDMFSMVPTLTQSEHPFAT